MPVDRFNVLDTQKKIDYFSTKTFPFVDDNLQKIFLFFYLFGFYMKCSIMTYLEFIMFKLKMSHIHTIAS